MRASAASASARVDLLRVDRAVETEATGRHVRARVVERGGRDVVTDDLVARERAHLRDTAAHHARAENPDLHCVGLVSGQSSGRSMRASQRPGATSSAAVGTIDSSDQSRLS